MYTTTYSVRKFCSQLREACKKLNPDFIGKGFEINCQQAVLDNVRSLEGKAIHYSDVTSWYKIVNNKKILIESSKDSRHTTANFAKAFNMCGNNKGDDDGLTVDEILDAEVLVFENPNRELDNMGGWIDDVYFPPTKPPKGYAPNNWAAIDIANSIYANRSNALIQVHRFIEGIKATFPSTAPNKALIQHSPINQIIGTLGAYIKCFEAKWDTQAKQISDALIAQWSSNSDYPKHVIIPAFTPFSPIPTGPINLTFSMPTFSGPVPALAY